jgi:hypothetical protein
VISRIAIFGLPASGKGRLRRPGRRRRKVRADKELVKGIEEIEQHETS